MTSLMPRVYLASQSPRRRQLLDLIGVAHELLLPDADEDAEALEVVRSNEAPRRYVERVTRAKLEAACQRWARRGLAAAPVLCADTTVAIGREILGKPADADEARDMLSRLSGRSHRVLTAVAVADDPTRPEGMRLLTSVSEVRFEPLEPAWIEAYIASGEPFGKAGAYAVQGVAATRISRMAGSYTGIMGLPLHETSRLLEQR
jgi:septum formation protein